MTRNEPAPYLPPIVTYPGGPYTPGINPNAPPPWVGGMVEIPPGSGPPTDEQIRAQNMGSPSPYDSGPFCFGLDKLICEQLPAKIHIGPEPRSIMGRYVTSGFDIPVQGMCGVLLNTLCGVIVAIILLTLLGVAFAAFLQ